MLYLNPSVSIAIATYEMSGRGRFFLRQALESIALQEYSDIEVVIYDDSGDDEIKNECAIWGEKMRVRYFQSNGTRLSPSQKFNQAIQLCEGSIVKLLCQDDLLRSDSAISRTVEGLSHGNVWLVSSYCHIDENNNVVGHHTPTINPRIAHVNSIGSQSGLAFLRERQRLLFDESLFWRMDCEMYRRLYEEFGPPFFLLSETVSVRQWTGQSTHTIVQRRDRLFEYIRVTNKHRKKLSIVQEFDEVLINKDDR